MLSPMLRLITVCVLGAWLAQATTVMAQEAQEEVSDDEARARVLFGMGDEHYANGRYEDALAAFEESYQLSGQPLLLFNMANAQERLGDYDGAVQSLQSYLPDAPEDEQARIESRIESLQARAERVRRLTEVPESAEPTPGISPVGPVLLGVGGAALVGGIVLAVRAGGARSDLDALCIERGDQRFCPEAAEDAEKRDLRSSIGADILFVAGAAAVGVGLYFLLRKAPSNDEVDAVVTDEVAYARWTHAF